jgi:hypothetical protein
MELAAEKAAMQGANRSNSGLLREFATPQGGYFPRQVRLHELISASLAYLPIRSTQCTFVLTPAAFQAEHASESDAHSEKIQ